MEPVVQIQSKNNKFTVIVDGTVIGEYSTLGKATVKLAKYVKGQGR